MRRRRRLQAFRDRFWVTRRSAARFIDPTVKTLEQELQNVAELARIDPLTGANNRRDWDGLCARREADPAEAFIVLDLDNFKQVNDRYGHNTGDLMLIYVSRHVSRVLTRYQLSARERFFRIGGDEFVVVAPVALGKQLMASMDAVLNGVTRTGEFAELPQEATVSFGYGSDFEAADRDMYQRKEAKKRLPLDMRGWPQD